LSKHEIQTTKERQIMKVHKLTNSFPGARLCALLAVSVGCAFAQTPPYALFQYSSLTGSGNTITATQVPLVIANGVTVYVNLTLQFAVDSNGIVTLVSGYPQEIPAPTIISSDFKSGTYAGPSTILNGGMIVTVAGPGVSDGGASHWTLSAGNGATSCTTPLSASWYVGPIASNILASRLAAAGITSTAYSYGMASGPNCNPSGILGSNWISALIGVSQVGNTLTLVSFTNGTTDYSTPQAQITYTLQQ
jgi:hypothetical protein